MIIKKIIKQKNGKYKILLLEDEIITYGDVILNNNILYKKNIDDDLYKKILEETKYYDIYNSVIKYISHRRRSEVEVKKYLDNQTNDSKIKSKILTTLKNINLINDYDYALSYINDKVYLSKYGINKIKNDLIELNIDKNIINELLDKYEYKNDKLEKLIVKKMNSNRKYSNSFLKQKLVNEFVNLGYNKEDIIEIIDNNLKDELDIIKKEYILLLKKYSSKYEENELNKIIINKLLSKGFPYEKINMVIKETEDF